MEVAKDFQGLQELSNGMQWFLGWHKNIIDLNILKRHSSSVDRFTNKQGHPNSGKIN